MKKKILKFINFFIPKNNKQIAFISYPDFSDNPRALFEYIKKNDTEYKLIWLIRDIEVFKILKEHNIQDVFFQNSLKGLFFYMKSKYIITSQTDLIGIKSAWQIYFDLWHGMPLKKFGLLKENFKESRWSKNSKKSNYRIATSNLTQALISASFGVEAKKVKVVGQSRTDFFKEDSNNYLKKLGIDKKKYKKIVLFLPTFRDFNSYKVDNIFRFDNFDSEKFTSFLKKNEILFITKLHHIDERKAEHLSNKDNFILLKNIDLRNQLIDLYHVLNEIDALITDYSSVYIDFLIKNKPIIFIPTDLDKYRSTQGLILEPYDRWTPGPKAYTQEGLSKELENLVLNQDNYSKKRSLITEILHKYQDINSSERIYKIIKSAK